MPKSCRPVSVPSWTAALRERFFACLAQSGNVREAAGACGLSRQSAYRLRRRDAAFARAWSDALRRRMAMLKREILVECDMMMEAMLDRHGRQDLAALQFAELIDDLFGLEQRRPGRGEKLFLRTP